jgi:hypothetical protein
MVKVTWNVTCSPTRAGPAEVKTFVIDALEPRMTGGGVTGFVTVQVKL